MPFVNLSALAASSQSSPQLWLLALKQYKDYLKRHRASREEALSADLALIQSASTRAYFRAKARKDALKAKYRASLVDPRGAFGRLYTRFQGAPAVVAQQDLGGSSLRELSPALSPVEATVLGEYGLYRRLVLAAVTKLSQAFMGSLTTTQIHHHERLLDALKRPSGQALITVSNHVAALDDPLLVAALCPPEFATSPEAMRWGLCATDRCFEKGKALASFFRAGKVLPVERGAGLGQPGLRAAEARLAAGDWLHIFPEGTRSRDGKLGPVRQGVGRLVAACSQPPLVVPFVHSGMERVFPRGAKLPHTGQRVEVLIGEPIEVADLLEAAESQAWQAQRLYRSIAARVREELLQLQEQLDVLLREAAGSTSPAAEAVSSEPEEPLSWGEEELYFLERPWHWQQPSLRSRAADSRSTFQVLPGLDGHRVSPSGEEAEERGERSPGFAELAQQSMVVQDVELAPGEGVLDWRGEDGWGAGGRGHEVVGGSRTKDALQRELGEYELLRTGAVQRLLAM